MIIGHLNRELGFNGFKTMEIGTPVYENGGIYYLWQEANGGLYCEMVRYYKDNLKTSINFI